MLTKEELEALAKSVSEKAQGATATLVKSSVEEAVKPLSAEIKTLQDAKKAAEDKAKDLEDKVTKLAATPLKVEGGNADLGKYLGADMNKAAAVILDKGFFKFEPKDTARNKAAGMAKYLLAVSKSMVTKDRSFYREYCKAANLEGADATGGYLVPEVLQPELIRAARENSFALQKCTVFNLSAEKVLFPAENALVSAYWVAENGAGTASDPTFAQVPVEAKKAMALTTGVSNELLQDSAIDFLGILIDQITYAIGQLVDDAVLNGISGDSVNFLGLLVAATGIQATTLGTAKYFKDVAYDNLVDAQTLLTGADAANAQYCFSRYGISLIKKLKDTTGQPIWASPVAGAPGTILGSPYFTSEKAPLIGDASTASKIFGVYGDFKQYYIGIKQGGNNMMLEADPYTNFGNDTIRYRMTMRIGGNPVRKSAFAVLKAGAAS